MKCVRKKNVYVIHSFFVIILLLLLFLSFSFSFFFFFFAFSEKRKKWQPGYGFILVKPRGGLPKNTHVDLDLPHVDCVSAEGARNVRKASDVGLFRLQKI